MNVLDQATVSQRIYRELFSEGKPAPLHENFPGFWEKKEVRMEGEESEASHGLMVDCSCYRTLNEIGTDEIRYCTASGDAG